MNLGLTSFKNSMNNSSGISENPSSSVFVGRPKGRCKLLVKCTERCHPWGIVADSTTEIVLFVEDDNACVPNALDMLADELAGELSGHAFGKVVHV